MAAALLGEGVACTHLVLSCSGGGFFGVKYSARCLPIRRITRREQHLTNVIFASALIRLPLRHPVLEVLEDARLGVQIFRPKHPNYILNL